MGFQFSVLFHCLEEEVDKIPLSKSNGTGVSLPGRYDVQSKTLQFFLLQYVHVHVFLNKPVK